MERLAKGHDDQIAGGKPVILGTRVPVALIVGHLAGGMSPAEVAEEYELQPEDILAALTYAARALEAVWNGAVAS